MAQSGIRPPAESSQQEATARAMGPPVANMSAKEFIEKLASGSSSTLLQLRVENAWVAMNAMREWHLIKKKTEAADREMERITSEVQYTKVLKTLEAEREELAFMKTATWIRKLKSDMANNADEERVKFLRFFGLQPESEAYRAVMQAAAGAGAKKLPLLLRASNPQTRKLLTEAVETASLEDDKLPRFFKDTLSAEEAAVLFNSSAFLPDMAAFAAHGSPTDSFRESPHVSPAVAPGHAGNSAGQRDQAPSEKRAGDEPFGTKQDSELDVGLLRGYKRKASSSAASGSKSSQRASRGQAEAAYKAGAPQGGGPTGTASSEDRERLIQKLAEQSEENRKLRHMVHSLSLPNIALSPTSRKYLHELASEPGSSSRLPSPEQERDFQVPQQVTPQDHHMDAIAEEVTPLEAVQQHTLAGSSSASSGSKGRSVAGVQWLLDQLKRDGVVVPDSIGELDSAPKQPPVKKSDTKAADQKPRGRPAKERNATPAPRLGKVGAWESRYGGVRARGNTAPPVELPKVVEEDEAEEEEERADGRAARGRGRRPAGAHGRGRSHAGGRGRKRSAFMPGVAIAEDAQAEEGEAEDGDFDVGNAHGRANKSRLGRASTGKTPRSQKRGREQASNASEPAAGPWQKRLKADDQDVSSSQGSASTTKKAARKAPAAAVMVDKEGSGKQRTALAEKKLDASRLNVAGPAPAASEVGPGFRTPAGPASAAAARKSAFQGGLLGGCGSLKENVGHGSTMQAANPSASKLQSSQKPAGNTVGEFFTRMFKNDFSCPRLKVSASKSMDTTPIPNPHF